MTMQQWWRLALAASGLLVIAYIGWRYYGMNGEFRAAYYFDTTANVISQFTPRGRALDREQNAENGEYYQRLIGEPVYFSINLPSAYPQADVTLEYQNPHQPVVQLGLRLSDDDTVWAFDFKPLENKFIDNSTWERLEDDQYIVLQRTPTYTSVTDFLTHPPVNAGVGTFLTTIEFPFVDLDYHAQPGSTVIDQPLRGAHTMMVYVQDEPLQVGWTYRDINFAAGPDPLTVAVRHLGEDIWLNTYQEDGDEGITGTASPVRSDELTLTDLPEGVYEVSFSGSDDIFFTEIVTSQHRVVFKNKLHLAGAAEYTTVLPDIVTTPATVYTRSNYVTMNAKHPGGLGEVQFYDGPLVVAKANSLYLWRNPIAGFETTVAVPHNDMELTNDSFFSFSKDTWFDPQFGFQPLNQYTRLEQLNYIITARYAQPERIRSWTTATASFDVTQAHRADATTLDFIISAPGLDTMPEGIKVRSITVVAHKEPITWHNAWERFTAKLW
ncbi:MAG: hypothetical protein HYV33_01810 [Candidatus Kerfeldbacteria bacterium]|nr:hypothetical protein [Candidatus Kerfeldbacteria bacterium]